MGWSVRGCASSGDHNETFRSVLPVEGKITRRLKLDGWKGTWYVLEFERPLDYDNREHHRAVIASRWVGHELGEAAGVSVFVLLPRNESVLEQVTPPHSAFDHVAWGTAIPVAAG